MRTQIRMEITPPTYSRGGTAAELASTHQETKILDPNVQLSFPSHWNSEDTRGLLYAMQWRVCAYCSRVLPGNDRGDVEHFRPKKSIQGAPGHGGYWWLGYRISNYVLSCGVCNSSRKGNKFPLRPRARHIKFENRSRLAREARLLLDPTVDDLDEILTIDIESDLVRVVPKDGVGGIKKAMIEKTIEFFRLNSDRWLIDDRIIVLDEVTKALDERDDDRARMLAVRYSPHSLVAKTVLENMRPDLLPEKSEEVQWLLSKIFGEIDTLLLSLESSPTDKRSLKELNESLWGLAALWKDPPDGDPDRIKSVLEDSGLLSSVEPLFVQF